MPDLTGLAKADVATGANICILQHDTMSNCKLHRCSRLQALALPAATAGSSMLFTFKQKTQPAELTL